MITRSFQVSLAFLFEFSLVRIADLLDEGVVPRTFIGAILTAVTAAPFTRITSGLNLPKLANL